MHVFFVLRRSTTDNLDVALYAHLCSDKYIEIVDGILHEACHWQASVHAAKQVRPKAALACNIIIRVVTLQVLQYLLILLGFNPVRLESERPLASFGSLFAMESKAKEADLELDASTRLHL